MPNEPSVQVVEASDSDHLLSISIYLFSLRPTVLAENVMQKPENGIVTKLSHHTVDQTVERISELLNKSGVKLFTVIDHSGEAEKSGLSMPPTKVVIFGNPKAGTPLMIASPTVAIDLPLKLLIAEDAEGKVWISYNSLDFLQRRHGLPDELLQNIAGIDVLATKAAE